MFAKGDHVFYASGGVCRVEDLQYAPLEGMPAERLYYVLRSLHDANGIIYLPVDCTAVFLRPLISREEGEALLRDHAALRPLEAPDAKALRAAYQEAMKTYEPREWLRVVKTVSERARRLAGASRTQRLSETERSIGEEARRYLLTELSVVLEQPVEQISAVLFGTPTAG